MKSETLLKKIFGWPIFILLFAAGFLVSQWAAENQHRNMTVALASQVAFTIFFIGLASFMRRQSQESFKFPSTEKLNLSELIVGFRIFWCVYASLAMLVLLILQLFPVPVWEMKPIHLANLYCLSTVLTLAVGGFLLWGRNR